MGAKCTKKPQSPAVTALRELPNAAEVADRLEQLGDEQGHFTYSCGSLANLIRYGVPWVPDGKVD
jgi:hypothetical protein